MRAVGGVGPLAVGADAERAVAVAAGHVGLRDEAVVAAINVERRELPAGAERRIGLGQLGAGVASDHHGVIGADDGDHNPLRRTVRSLQIDGFVVSLSRLKLVVSRVGHEGPVTVRIDAETAVAFRARHVTLRYELVGRPVQIQCGQLATDSENLVGLGQGGIRGAADDRGEGRQMVDQIPLQGVETVLCKVGHHLRRCVRRQADSVGHGIEQEALRQLHLEGGLLQRVGCRCSHQRIAGSEIDVGLRLAVEGLGHHRQRRVDLDQNGRSHRRAQHAFADQVVQHRAHQIRQRRCSQHAVRRLSGVSVQHGQGHHLRCVRG